MNRAGAKPNTRRGRSHAPPAIEHRLEAGLDEVPREGLDALACRAPQAVREAGLALEPGERGPQRPGLARGDEQAVDAVDDEIAHPGDWRRDDREAARHRLEQDVGPALAAARAEHEAGGFAEQRRQPLPTNVSLEARVDAAGAGEAHETVAPGSFARHGQPPAVAGHRLPDYDVGPLVADQPADREHAVAAPPDGGGWYIFDPVRDHLELGGDAGRARARRAGPEGRRRRQLEVIPNGVDLPPPAVGRRGDRVLTVGRLIRDKGTDVVVEAMAGNGGRLTVAGEGPERDRLVGLARARGVDARFEGYVGRERLAALFREASCLVLGARRGEGRPNVLLEAMARGLPVVATPIAGVSDLVVDGVNGLLVPAGEPGALRPRSPGSSASPASRTAWGARRARASRPSRGTSSSPGSRRCSIAGGACERPRPRLLLRARAVHAVELLERVPERRSGMTGSRLLPYLAAVLRPAQVVKMPHRHQHRAAHPPPQRHTRKGGAHK